MSRWSDFDYSKWQEETEDRNVLSDEEVAERLARYEALQNGAVKNSSEKIKLAEKTEQFKGVQMSLFDIMPEDEKAKLEKPKEVKKNTKKTTKKGLESKEAIIKKEAKIISDLFENLEDAVRFLEYSASINKNICIEFYGKELYSLLDDKNSCYMKVTGMTYDDYKEKERLDYYEDLEYDHL